MAAAWKEFWSNSTPGTAALTIAPAADDFLIGVAMTDTNDVFAATAPTGWTADADAGMASTNDNATLYACHKKATGSETSVTFAHQFGANFICHVASYSGVDTTTPLDVTPVTLASSTAAANTDLGPLTPTKDGCVFAYTFGADETTGADVGFTFSTVSGTTGAWTTRIDQHASFYDLAHGSALQTTAGAITARCARTLTGGRLAILYVLRPAAAAGGGATKTVYTSLTGAGQL